MASEAVKSEKFLARSAGGTAGSNPPSFSPPPLLKQKTTRPHARRQGFESERFCVRRVSWKGLQFQGSLYFVPLLRIDTRFVSIVAPLRYNVPHFFNDRFRPPAFHGGALCIRFEILQSKFTSFAIHRHLMTGCPFSAWLITIGHVERGRE